MQSKSTPDVPFKKTLEKAKPSKKDSMRIDKQIKGSKSVSKMPKTK